MPSPLSHTTLSKLIVKFLKALDSYNANDLTVSDTDTDSDTAGERARVCLNLALQSIYGIAKDTKYLQSYPVTSLSSTASQDFIDLDPEAYLDEIDAITDTTNDVMLIKRSWTWYRSHFTDPSNTSGVPRYYCRRNNRIYLAPRPDASYTYTIDFVKLTKDLELPNDLPLLPTQFDPWIIAEAKVWWYGMEDPTQVPQSVINERDIIRVNSLVAIKGKFDEILVAGSRIRPFTPTSLPYQRPIPE